MICNRNSTNAMCKKYLIGSSLLNLFKIKVVIFLETRNINDVHYVSHWNLALRNS